MIATVYKHEFQKFYMAGTIFRQNYANQEVYIALNRPIKPLLYQIKVQK